MVFELDDDSKKSSNSYVVVDCPLGLSGGESWIEYSESYRVT